MNIINSVTNTLKGATSNLSYNDLFSNVESAVSTFTGKLQGISLTVIIACLAITGLMFIFGEGPSRAAKKWLIYIIVGAVIIFGASTFGTTIQDISGF
ncbi:TrbC/VirB2 family protein [Virgibacillus halodenitrificans]|uniref:TrbC/VirB2 family protein n=1 Tax=Virgibacillus halodenitrificans TaxID=1482 RepID=UPI00045CDF79|nr:TrbC/VirB2 family protein [Virgibacillus halodenitrificans]CDQ37707.1 TrbC/VIRB2 family protein [Virgibacillus halodenitrificans]